MQNAENGSESRKQKAEMERRLVTGVWPKSPASLKGGRGFPTAGERHERCARRLAEQRPNNSPEDN